MKSIFLLLLILLLSMFIFSGCNDIIPSEGEGEGEEDIVTVEIESAIELEGKKWVACGNHGIKITFPTPVERASAYITSCTGYYGKYELSIDSNISEGDIVLFPNEDKTVWTGSGFFGCSSIPNGLEGKNNSCSHCCASYIEVSAGECKPETCITFPVIVDCDKPYALIEFSSEACECEGCEVFIYSSECEQECAEAEECCGDWCSGLAGWSIGFYDNDPFNECCETPCEEPIYTCSGTECPIECLTECFNEDKLYYVVVNLVDNVGHETEYYFTVDLDSNCEICITEYPANGWNQECTTWE